MLWVDLKYIGALAPRLSMFSRKSDNIWNMRCPICGDSRKSKTKARGYILSKGDGFVYVCHNCNASMSFGKFLETIDPNAYTEYRKELYLERNNVNTERIKEPTNDISKFITPKFIKFTELSKLKKISQLAVDHPAKVYVVNRKIPSHFHSKLFYAPKFKQWTNSIQPSKFNLKNGDEPRLVIPFLDKENNMFAYQGRSFFDKGPRYITIVLDEKTPRLFGLERLDLSQHVFIVEGPIDSLFLPNCIAMAGSHMDKISMLNPSKTTFIYDNEPRNANIVSSIERMIRNGYNVCIWPENMLFKDINDMVVSGMTTSDIQKIITNNTYRDLLALMQLNQWKRV